MAKKTGPQRPADSRAARAELKRVDEEIVKALHRRAELARQVGQARPPADDKPLLPDDDEPWLDWVESRSVGPMPRGTVRAVFREILSGCRALVRRLRIAHLGPYFSYSHLAAMRRFGQEVEFLPVGTIAAVFEEVHAGHADFGLVPIENSTDGRVSDTLDMFTRLPMRICGEVELPIRHALLARCRRDEIHEVCSKPQALSQCRNWLAKHLPDAQGVEVTSTSTAAEMAAKKPGTAAIASVQAGVHFGLEVLAERIEDNPANTTRFSIIGHESAPRTGKDKTAMMFHLEDRPGALADALGIVRRNRVNLTWIESFPIPGPDRAYLFFVEMEGHETDPRVRRATAALRQKTLRLEILGSFSVAPAD
ncbi:MAG: prephenate dehydratase [Pirellulales bacterium]|nr:prephenate dehydratase [Pirellulales bacterium]